MKKNNIVLGFVAGLAAAVLGAAIWAGITIVTVMQIGLIAIGIGFITGHAVSMAGKGNTIVFSFIGGTLSLLACLLGNLMTSVGLYGQELGLGIMEALRTFPYDQTVEMLTLTFSPMDLLFYAFAGYYGWNLATNDDRVIIADVENEEPQMPIFVRREDSE